MMNIIVHDFLFYLETIAIVLLFTYVAFHFEMRDWPESQGIWWIIKKKEAILRKQAAIDWGESNFFTHTCNDSCTVE